MTERIISGVLCALSAISAATACTSWIVPPSGSATGGMLIHKCRDSYRRPLDADFRQMPGKFRWLRVGLESDQAAFAMNERGLVIIANQGDDVRQKVDPTLRQAAKREGGQWVTACWAWQTIASECSTAKEAVARLRRMVKLGQYFGNGDIAMIADPKQAFVVEYSTGGRMQIHEVTADYCVYANGWKLPGMESDSVRKVAHNPNDQVREGVVRKYFTELRARGGKIGVADCFAASRIADVPKMTIKRGRGTYIRKHKDQKVHSLGCVTFEPDAEFPAELSCAYVALGSQRHTVYLPIPMCADNTPPEMKSGAWGEYAFRLHDILGDDNPRMKELEAFEAKALAEFTAARKRARKLLRAGRRAEARRLMNDLLVRQSREARTLLARMLADTGEAVDVPDMDMPQPSDTKRK